MDRITAARAFITIVEQGSFVGAAEALNMSRAGASRCVAEMEDWTKAKLLHRSTRKLSLTPAGEQMLEQCRRLLEVADVISNASLSKGMTPSGRLRISCTNYFAQCTMIDLLLEYRALYPDVNVELIIADHVVNLVEERIDLAIRISNSLDPNLLARKFGDCTSTVCASPSYIERFGVPRNLNELSAHNCLVYSNFEKQFWHFSYKDEKYSIPVLGGLASNENMVLLSAALKGMGITMQPTDAVMPYIEQGALIPILGKYEPQKLGVHGVFLTRKNMPVAQRKMIDFLVRSYKQ